MEAKWGAWLELKSASISEFGVGKREAREEKK